jgi:quercetin dioxygenase-like cupin family protein
MSLCTVAISTVGQPAAVVHQPALSYMEPPLLFWYDRRQWMHTAQMRVQGETSAPDPGGFGNAMKIRRVVTGHDAHGKSLVQWDSDIESRPGRPGFEQVPLWATDRLPVRLTEDDPITWELGTSLANGSVFRIARYEPGVAGRWHRTDSIDYGIVLAGELWMQLDTGEVHLKAGNVVIQRGTLHNWENRGTEPCLMAFILIATEGGASTGWA